jgi:hypothetical protein
MSDRGDMRRIMKNLLLIFWLCIFATSQRKSIEKTTSASPETPIFEVKFDKDPALSVPFEETGMSAEGCDNDGNPYVQVYNPIRASTAVLKLSADGITTLFDPGKITDIVEPLWVFDFVSNSKVYALIEGDVHREQHRTSDGGWSLEIKGEPRYYIAEFDADGSYKRALKLDLSFRPTRIAGFQSGDFLVSGYDGSNVSHLALLDSSGQLLRYIELPKEKQQAPEEVYARSFGTKPITASTAAHALSAFASLFQYQNDVLYVRGRSATPIYSISDGGEVRTLPIKAPKGYSVEYMLPSDNNWFVVSAELGKYDNDNNVIYEVNPSTGELVARYLSEGLGRAKTVDWQSDLACVHEREFVLVHHDREKLTVLRGRAMLGTKHN